MLRAHDLLAATLELVTVAAKDGVTENDRVSLMMTAATDVLCWVLGHEHNQTFARNLAELELLMEEQGYRLYREEEAASGHN